MRKIATAVIIGAVTGSLLLSACSNADSGNTGVDNGSSGTLAPLDQAIADNPEALLLTPEKGALVSSGDANPIEQRLDELGVQPGTPDGDAATGGIIDGILITNNSERLIGPQADGSCPLPGDYGFTVNPYATETSGWYLIADKNGNTTISKINAGTATCKITIDNSAPVVPDGSGNIPGTVSASIENTKTIGACYAVMKDYPEVEWLKPSMLESISVCQMSGKASEEALNRLKADKRVNGAGQEQAYTFDAGDGGALLEQAIERNPQYFPADQTRLSGNSLNGSARGLVAGGRPGPTPSGEGVRIYIVDSGVSTVHPEFRGRLMGGTSLGFSGTSDGCVPHGTHVAGLAAGLSSGYATLATIVPVRISGKCNVDGGSPFAASSFTRGTIVTDALEWVLADVKLQKNPLFVVNLSLGRAFARDVNKYQKALIGDIRKAGGIVVKSAGNESTNFCEDSNVPEYADSELVKEWAAPGNSIIVGALQTRPEESKMWTTLRDEKHMKKVEEALAGAAPDPIIIDSEAGQRGSWRVAAAKQMDGSTRLKDLGAFATTNSSPMTVSTYSNYGSCIDLWADGAGYSASGYYANPITPNAPKFLYMNGTSMSAPIVSGAAAAWLSEFGKAGDSRNRDLFLAQAQTTGTPLQALLVGSGDSESQAQERVSTNGDESNAWRSQVALYYPGLMNFPHKKQTLPRMGIAVVPDRGSTTYIQTEPRKIMIHGFTGDMFNYSDESVDPMCYGQKPGALPRTSITVDGVALSGTVVGCTQSDGGAPFFDATTFILLDEPFGTVEPARQAAYARPMTQGEPLHALIEVGSGWQKEPSSVACFVRDNFTGGPGCYIDAKPVAEPLFGGEMVPRAYVDYHGTADQVESPSAEPVKDVLDSLWLSFADRISLVDGQVDPRACDGVDKLMADVCMAANQKTAKALNALCDDSPVCGQLVDKYSIPMRKAWESAEYRKKIVTSVHQGFGENADALYTPRYSVTQLQCDTGSDEYSRDMQSWLRDLVAEDAKNTGLKPFEAVKGNPCSLSVDLPIVGKSYNPEITSGEAYEFDGVFAPGVLAALGTNVDEITKGRRTIDVNLKVSGCEGCTLTPVSNPSIEHDGWWDLQDQWAGDEKTVKAGSASFEIPEKFLPALAIEVRAPWEKGDPMAVATAIFNNKNGPCYGRKAPTGAPVVSISMKAVKKDMGKDFKGSRLVVPLLLEDGATSDSPGWHQDLAYCPLVN